jgi:four helix bundle protein
MRDYTKLRVFELADRLAIEIYRVTQSFPREEQFGLTSQMRRAAVSAASNIVEGCARHTEVEYIRFLDIAFGSVRELDYQISLARRLRFLHAENADDVVSLAQETSKVLGGLIRSLRQLS